MVPKPTTTRRRVKDVTVGFDLSANRQAVEGWYELTYVNPYRAYRTFFKPMLTSLSTRGAGLQFFEALIDC